MRNFLIVICISLFGMSMVAQELNCTVKVIADLTGRQNNVVFKTLESQLTEFVNNTKWTNQSYNSNEKIECSMVITITAYDNDNFTGSIQVSSSRPVFNSTYRTPLLNFNDKDFNFKYLEFQNIVFNPNQYESNLVSVIAFHIYVILGLDADSFKLNGGLEHFKQAQIIANYSQPAGAGWTLQSGPQSRFALIDDLLSPTYEEYRTTMYNYHIKGLDLMADNPREGKEQIAKHLMELKNMHRRRPNSFLMRVFFDAKSDEIRDIFGGGPSTNIADLADVLKTVAPMYSSKWGTIRF